ncbi:hypothetical protein CsSME_00013647 [Camellia sinensis var. sinensis]
MMNQARQRIMARVEKIFSERRSGSGAHHEDFLQHLLTETPSLTDAQIKDNILTMIIAGQDTTASAIAWMVKFLGENQEIINTLKVSATKIDLCNHGSPPHSCMYIYFKKLLLPDLPFLFTLH